VSRSSHGAKKTIRAEVSAGQPPGLSFSSTQRTFLVLMRTATLGKALIRLRLLYPLARLRVSGQWLVFAW